MNIKPKVPQLNTFRKQLMTLPNKITLVRLAVIPFVLIIYPLGWSVAHGIAALLFFAGAVTDALDGHFARKTGQVTELGKLLDPLADKLLVCSCIVILASYDVIYTFLAVILIGREIFVNGLRLISAEHDVKIEVSQIGKWKTIVQSVAIFCLLLAHPKNPILFKQIGMVAIWIATGISLYSGFLYFEIFKNKVIEPKPPIEDA